MLSREEFFRKARASARSIEELYHAYEAYSICPAARSAGPDIFSGEEAACRRCGTCCMKPWRIEVAKSDLRRWHAEGRQDILSTLRYLPRKGGADGDSVYIMPKGPDGCMYLVKYPEMTCAIYDTRPEACVRFPRS